MNSKIIKLKKLVMIVTLLTSLFASSACKKVEVPTSSSQEHSIISSSNKISENDKEQSNNSGKESDNNDVDNNDSNELTSSNKEQSNDDQQIEKPSTSKENRDNIPKESAKKNDEYFNTALFIGDSRAQSLMLYGTLYEADFIVSRGYNAPKYFKESIPINQSNYIGKNFVEKNKDKYKNVYLMLGTNELGYTVDSFIANYSKVLNHVKENNSNASIYVCAILPVTREKDSSGGYVNNKIIKEFNDRLYGLAKDESVWFLDSSSIIQDSEGYLPKELSPDGVHFDKATVLSWQEYIQKHVVEN